MKRIRSERPKHRRERWWLEIFPIDPRDPDVLRVKSLAYAEGTGRDPLEGGRHRAKRTGEGRKTPRFLSDFSSVPRSEPDESVRSGQIAHSGGFLTTLRNLSENSSVPPARAGRKGRHPPGLLAQVEATYPIGAQLRFLSPRPKPSSRW
jgi:hypothetical protein